MTPDENNNTDEPTTTEAPAEPEAIEAVDAVRKSEPTNDAGDDVPLRPEGEKALEAWKVRARKAEAEQKELAARVKEFEDRDLSEQERLAKAAEEAKTAADRAAAENLRLRVALDKNLPPELIDRLRGDSVDELEADAEQLLALVKPREVTEFDGGARQSVKGVDRDEAIRLLRDDPDEFHRRREAGEIPDDVLAV